jgi:hypothetical protein
VKHLAQMTPLRRMLLAVLTLPATSSIFSWKQPGKPGDDSCTIASHAVSVPGAGSENYAPVDEDYFSSGMRACMGISERSVLCTFLIYVGAMHIFDVIGLLSCFEGGG